MNKHTDDVTCIAFAPNGMDVVTGENGAKPVVHVWDGITMQIKHSLVANGIVKSIQNVAYSPSGNRIGIVDQSDSHNVAIYDAATGTCVAKSKGPASKIIEMAFADDNNFVTVGARHFASWTIASVNVKSRLGNFGAHD